MTLKLAQLLQAGGQGRDRRGLLDSLTERERQILDHLARGESNKTIARALDISHDTVKLHVRHILSKLNLSSRVEARGVRREEVRSGAASTAGRSQACCFFQARKPPATDKAFW
jgi:two-component system nitrate/nitrite response regulator NarL